MSEYSSGHFDKHLELSPNLDEWDAVITGINMLGEELKATTISRDYFNNIFNSVSDMVFVLDKRGIINNVNAAAVNQLGYDKNNLINKPINSLQSPQRDSFNNILSKIKRTGSSLTKNTYFHTSSKKEIPVSVAVNFLFDEHKRRVAILLTAKDITAQLESDNLILRAIIDTEEKERQRLAKDLHDSLGQQLSAIKFYISATVDATVNEEQKLILIKSNEALARVQADMRNICFNLMPKTLQEFGLIKAVKELCSQIESVEKIKFQISKVNELPPLKKEIQIDLFRIIQEFISNAVDHGKANKVFILFKFKNNYINIILRDNGEGFNQTKLVTKGMGLQNVQSRVKSHNGEISITSAKDKGTKYKIFIPVNE